MPLGKLFSGELVPNDADAYLDQRFLDFLAVNGEQMHRMHWRNFERLIAEFFKRLRYIVSLGPGRKDGGVDLRIWPDEKAHTGPPLLLVQCKRYGRGKLIEVEYIKSLWTDVVYEKAQQGLLATTARA